MYKQVALGQIEERYATLIEKRGFKKYKDMAMTSIFKMSYQYKIEVGFREEAVRKNCRIVQPLDFDSHMFTIEKIKARTDT